MVSIYHSNVLTWRNHPYWLQHASPTHHGPGDGASDRLTPVCAGLFQFRHIWLCSGRELCATSNCIDRCFRMSVRDPGTCLAGLDLLVEREAETWSRTTHHPN